MKLKVGLATDMYDSSSCESGRGLVAPWLVFIRIRQALKMSPKVTKLTFEIGPADRDGARSLLGRDFGVSFEGLVDIL